VYNLSCSASVVVSGEKFKVVNKACTYLIYSLSGSITLSATTSAGDPGTITASSPFGGVLRVVKLNDQNHEQTLDDFVSTYATGVKTDHSFSGDEATLSFTWTVVGDQNKFLMLSWPHHRSVEK
jgi:endo-1,3(4)-beta-glucanase